MRVTAAGSATTATIYTASPGGGANDWANLADMIASGVRSIALADGMTFAAASPLNLVSGLTIFGSRGGGVISSMANNGIGHFENSVFYVPKTNLSSGNTLTANVVQYANTVTATSAVAVGTYVIVTCTSLGNVQYQARVLATSGSGPYVLTLDEECPFTVLTVANGAYLFAIAPVTGVQVIGQGMRIAGSGDRVAEVVAGRGVVFSDLIVDHSIGNGVDGFLNPQYSDDNGCVECGFIRCTADGGATTLSGTKGIVGFARESSLRCFREACKAIGFTNGSNAAAFADFDSSGGWQRGCTALHSTAGFVWGTNESNGVDGSEDTFSALESHGCTIGFTFDKSSKVRGHGMVSIADTLKVMTTLSGSPVIDIDGFRWVAPPTGGWNGWTGNHGELHLVNGTIDMTPRTSGNKAICDWSSGTGAARLKSVRVSATATGTFGIFIENGIAGTAVLDDVDLGSVGTPLTYGTTGTIKVQQAGLASVSTTGGNTTLTWPQSTCLVVEMSGTLASNATMTLVPIRGASYIVRNNTSGAFTAGLKITSTVNVAQGTTAVVRVTAAGDVEGSEVAAAADFFSLDVTLVAGAKTQASGKDLSAAKIVSVILKTPTVAVGSVTATISGNSVVVASYTAGAIGAATDASTYTVMLVGAV